MADQTPPRSTVSTESAVIIRQPPALLLMISRVRAAEATLELGLAEVQRRAGDAVHRLTRLGAARAWAGTPHPDDQANSDPLAAHMREAAARRLPPVAAIANRPGINIAVAATWNIATLTPEGVLALVDRLRFDVAADTDTPTPPAEPSKWADPMEQIQQMMARVATPADDLSPKFLYLARATDEQLAQAAADAYKGAQQRAERLAKAAGLRLSGVCSLSNGHIASTGRADQLMAQQRSAALLGAVGYQLAEGEVASEDPRAAEVALSVYATHYLES